jgi:hypothetical protein
LSPPPPPPSGDRCRRLGHPGLEVEEYCFARGALAPRQMVGARKVGRAPGDQLSCCCIRGLCVFVFALGTTAVDKVLEPRPVRASSDVHAARRAAARLSHAAAKRPEARGAPIPLLDDWRGEGRQTRFDGLWSEGRYRGRTIGCGLGNGVVRILHVEGSGEIKIQPGWRRFPRVRMDKSKSSPLLLVVKTKF